MINSILLAAVQSTMPNTPAWSPTTGIVMTIFCILGLVLARVGVRNPGAGPALPFPIPGFSGKYGLPEFIAGMSFGHILGTGAILGLSNAGLL